ncbi:MAG: hypothetical protein LW884_11015 [Bacteroidetes bacterium]|jgi:hypothetical protein|nr:hypothetical protein [Bacteroidota bacterium]
MRLVKILFVLGLVLLGFGYGLPVLVYSLDLEAVKTGASPAEREVMADAGKIILAATVLCLLSFGSLVWRRGQLDLLRITRLLFITGCFAMTGLHGLNLLYGHRISLMGNGFIVVGIFLFLSFFSWLLAVVWHDH